ncbi:MAG: peptidylprolyl isomerase [Clostridia bacterium]|nr:peptidylprolyl isomerase [Clostridia bacterium]
MKFKGILGGVVAMVLAVSPTLAGAEGIGIVIDGEEFVAKNALGEVVEPFIEDGSTFLPVRALGEAVGKEVSFDAENYAVYIGEEPSEDAVWEKAALKINDRIFYESDIDAYGVSAANTYYYAMIESAVTMAEETFSKEEIEAKRDEYVAQFAEGYDGDEEKAASSVGLTVTAIERLYYYNSCIDLLMDAIEIPEEKYDEYVTVKHILTYSEDEVEEIYAALKEGADFDDLIEKYNQDPGQTRDSSYTFTTGVMVEEFEKAAFELEEGEYTEEAVESAYGYHIIKRLPLDRDAADEELESEKFEILELMLTEAMLSSTVTEVEYSGEDYGEVDGIVISKEALKELDETGSYYEEAFYYYSYMMAAYEACVNEGYFSELEIASVQPVEESLAAKLNALAAFSELVSEKLTAGEIDIDELDAAIAEAQKTRESKIYSDVRAYVDGELIVPTDVSANYVAPKNVDGTVYLPVRAIAEALGMSVEWDNEARSVVIEK